MADWLSAVDARCQSAFAAYSCASTEDLLTIEISGGMPLDFEMSACDDDLR